MKGRDGDMDRHDNYNIGPVSGWNLLVTIAVIAVVAVSAWLPGCGDDEGEQGTSTSAPTVTQTGGFDTTLPISVPAGPGYTVIGDQGE